MRLVHLRLEASPPTAGVREILLGVAAVKARAEQLALFAQGRKREARAAEAVFAQLRAELGNEAVRKAVLRDGHLPEDQFEWVAWEKPAVVPGEIVAAPTLVRRIAAAPARLTPWQHNLRDDGWHISGVELGGVIKTYGPFVFSGRWWRDDLHREYIFAETKRGECLWLFYDRRARKWFEQGRVE
jgi:protein ImuB